MRSRKFRYIAHKIRVGARCRCPNCEQGRLFTRRFQVKDTCDYCQSRFKRASGDAIGGAYINVAVAELTALALFFLVEALLSPPLVVHIALWVSYLLLFTLWFYRHARGMWIAITYLTGGIYPDPDYTREYIAPPSAPIRAGSAREPHE